MFETLEFYLGKELHFDSLAKRLFEFGYQRQQQVSSQGEFSIRGSIVDIFPLHFSMPVRLELSHETIESIHTFDHATGQRLEPHRMVILLPVKDGRTIKTHHWHRQLTGEYETPLDPFVDIESGDLVVHVIHWIARYRGIKPLKNKEGRNEDHFTLEFEEKNILYVPTKDLHLIQRYVAFGKIRPKLSKLGSKSWQRLKDKTKKGVFSFAAELLEMQAKRRALQGTAFQKDTE